jgi:hypothetical protein
MSSAHPTPFTLINVGTNNTSMPSLLAQYASSATLSFFSINDYLVDNLHEILAGSGTLWSSGTVLFNKNSTVPTAGGTVANNGAGTLANHTTAAVVTTDKGGALNSETIIVDDPNIQSALVAGIPSYMPGTNVASCNQANGYNNSNTRGELIIDGGKATTGTICTVKFSTALATAPSLCTVWQNGGNKEFGLGHGSPSKSGFAIMSSVSVAASKVTVDYYCQP